MSLSSTESNFRTELRKLFKLQSPYDVTTPASDDDKIDESINNFIIVINDYIKESLATVEIPIGTVIVSVSGGSGSPAVGVPNPAPIPLTGDPDSGTGGIT